MNTLASNEAVNRNQIPTVTALPPACVTMIPLPTSKEDLTPEWFTSILNKTRVESVHLQSLGESDSISGYVYRAKLTYADETHGAPDSVVLKLPRQRDLRTPTLRLAYEREVRFYQNLAPHLEALVPRLIYADFDTATSDYVLVLEDFPEAQVTSNETGATSTQAYSLLGYIARLHARYWLHPHLQGYGFLSSVSRWMERFNADQRQRLPVFLQRFSPFIQPGEMEIFKALPDRFTAAVEPLVDAPQTLIHNDFSMKNILISGGSSDPRFILIDWALVGRGPGVRDVSFFIENSVPPRMRSEDELVLLRHYWECLCGEGVSGYSFERMLEDYRRSVVLDLSRMMWNGGVDHMTPVFESIIKHEIRGRTGSAVELGLLSLL